MSGAPSGVSTSQPVVGEKVSAPPDESIPIQSSFGLDWGCKLTVPGWVLCPVVPCQAVRLTG
jgi:hypothetical protein